MGPSTDRDLLADAVPTEHRADQRRRSEQLGWKRDPFTRGSALSGLTGLTLSGILWDAHRPMAMINDQMVRVGETLDGYTIVEITADHVSMTDGTDTFQLQIAP